MKPTSSQPPLPKQNRHFPWKTLILSFLVITLAFFGFKTCSAPFDALRGFTTARITHIFNEEVTKIEGTDGDVLEVATMENEETFAQSDETRIFWDSIDLGGTDSEIRVPATFRYHILLSGKWDGVLKDNVYTVTCPPYAATLPTAIHTDRISKKSSGLWSLWNGSDKLEELEKGITPALDARAGDQQHRELVREQCRHSIEMFVKNILIKREVMGQLQASAIKIVFPDELNSQQGSWGVPGPLR